MRHLNLLRMKPSRWDSIKREYVNRDVGQTLDQGSAETDFDYPNFQTPVFAADSWKGRPVAGTDYSKVPLFWTPHQCARLMGLDLATYLNDWCPVRPARVPTRRPKAVIYNTATDAGATQAADLVRSAVSDAGMTEALLAKGVWVGRCYQIEEAGFLTGGGVLPDGAFTSIGGFVPLLTPLIGRYGNLWLADPFSGNDSINVRELMALPLEAGEILYVQPQELHQDEWPAFTTDPLDRQQFHVFDDTLDMQAEFLEESAAAHDRCCFYGAYVGHDQFPDDGHPYQWTLTRDTILPALAARAPSFDYDTVDAVSFAAGQAALVQKIKAKIVSFFNLNL